MKWLVTGSDGYLGAHTVKVLKSNGVDVVSLDINSQRNLSNKEGFYEIDITKYADLLTRLHGHEDDFEGILHLAAKKDVSESQSNPDLYLETNVRGTENLLKLATEWGIKNFVLASSAAVYGNVSDSRTISEDLQIAPINVYGKSKVDAETLVANWSKDLHGKSSILRYFNLAGCDYGVEPETKGSNLIPAIISKILESEQIEIFGNDFDTPDGTCIRDFVHVLDVANANLKAINFTNNLELGRVEIFNIGSGKGASVLEVVKTFDSILNCQNNFVYKKRRTGDSPVSISNISKANQILNWRPKFDLNEIVSSAILTSKI